MAQLPRLSNREWDVLKLLLQGKSNKQIAASLGISVRTVEFHLTNIYAKYRVSSRIELILTLGNAAGKAEVEKLGHSTVARQGENAENRDRHELRLNWAKHLIEAVSIIGKESEMKSFMNSKPVFVAMLTALVAGSLWIFGLIRSALIFPSEIKPWLAPLILVWAAIGLSVGFIAKHNNLSLRRVFFGALFGAGLSPLTIYPLMMYVLLPIGKLAQWLGFIDPSRMANDVATRLGMIAMIAIWLLVGSSLGVVSLFLTIIKPEPKVVQTHLSEHSL